MKTLDLRKASKSLAEYTAELDSESIVITSNEKPIAALVSLRGMDRESVALSLSPELSRIIRAARSEAKRGKVFSLDEVKRGLLEATAPNQAMQPTRSATKPRRVPSARKRRSPRRG